jgi:hypothetical protein
MSSNHIALLKGALAALQGSIGAWLQAVGPERVPHWIGPVLLISAAIFAIAFVWTIVHGMGWHTHFIRLHRNWRLPSPVPKRDTPLRQAVFYAVHGRWLAEHEHALSEDGQGDKAVEIITEIRQFARDNIVTVWGKKWNNSTWDPIPADYWSSHQIDVLSLFRNNPDHTKTEAGTPEGKGLFFRSLMVSKKQIEAHYRVRQ